MRRLSLVLGLLALLATPAAATDYWVDPQARGGECSDGDSGLVLEEALCTLEACIGKRLQPGDRCILREGTYTTMPDPGIDGAPTAPIVFARYGRERVVIAGGTLDLRERSDVRYEGLHFWNVRMLLQGARRIALAECTLEEGLEALPDLAEPDSTGAEPAFPGDDPVELIPKLPRGGGDEGEGPRALGIEAGGTGATSVEAARLNLGVPALEDVIRSYGNDWVSGTKIFTEQVFSRRTNGTRHSGQFGSIAECLADITTERGLCHIDPFEDDATPFGRTNPAGVDAQGSQTGTKDALVVDARGGRLKWLSSARPPWSSSVAPASENDVPFVFQTRYHDSTHLMADSNWDGQRDGDSWACNLDLKTCSGSGRLCAIDADCDSGACLVHSQQEWRACPYGHFTGGQDLRDRSWWYTGQCNSNVTGSGQRMLCGGQSIFEVRYPQVDDGDGVWEAGEHVDKPAFKVGTHGVGIYFPESQGPDNVGMLTVFRSNDSSYWATPVKNKPFFSVHKDGTYLDGGLFVGNTNNWPYPFNGSQWEHDPFNAWVNHDIAPGLPALVVEGPNNEDYASEVTPIFSVYSRAGYYTSHKRDPGVNQEVALEVTANGDLILGATCPPDADGCTGTMEDSQRIIWKGTDPRDAYETVLHVQNPTARRDLYLPDASGVLALAGSSSTRIDCGSVQVNPADLAPEQTLIVPVTAPTVLRHSACVCSAGQGLHDDVFVKNCAPPADGQLEISLYNPTRQVLPDADTPTFDVDYCCISP